MIFNTFWFLIFMVIVYPLFLLMPSAWGRFFLILAASVIFHGHYAGPAGVAPIVVMGVITYWVALYLEHRAQAPAVSRDNFRWMVALGLCVPTLGLLYYKYRYLMES
jgi:hypothetical protein